MKRIVIIYLFLIINGFFLFCLNTEKQVKKAIEKLSLEFLEKYPNLVFRPNLAIVSIENNSPLTKKYEIGAVISSIIESLIQKSIIFNIVEVRLREKQIQEMEFSLSGFTNPGQLKIGKMTVIDYYLLGSITEINHQFRITIKLVSVETGVVESTAVVEIHKDQLIEVSENFKSAYVNPYGIGIEIGALPWFYFYGPMADLEGQAVLGDTFLFQLYLNYRVQKWLMAWAGLEFAPGALRFFNTSEDHQTNSLTDSDFKNLDSGALPSGQYKYAKERSPFFSLTLGAGGVINFTKELNLTLGASILMSQTFLVQKYSIPFTSGAAEDLYSHIIQSSDITLWSARPLIKLQYFITPRVAVQLNYGFNIQFAESPASRFVFQDGYYGKDSTIPNLWNLDPSVTPGGASHVTNITGHYISMSVGLYF